MDENNLTFNGMPIGYLVHKENETELHLLNKTNNEFLKFDQKSGQSLEEEFNINDLSGIKIGKASAPDSTTYACLPSGITSESLAFFLEQTTFSQNTKNNENSKKNICLILDELHDLDVLLYNYNKEILSQQIMPLLQKCITSICNSNDIQDNQVPVLTFLKNVKECCDTNYSEACNAIETTPYVDVGFMVLLIAYLYFFHKYQCNTVLEAFFENKLSIIAYLSFIYIDYLNLEAYLKLNKAHKKYIAAYEKLLKDIDKSYVE